MVLPESVLLGLFMRLTLEGSGIRIVLAVAKDCLR